MQELNDKWRLFLSFVLLFQSTINFYVIGMSVSIKTKTIYDIIMIAVLIFLIVINIIISYMILPKGVE